MGHNRRTFANGHAVGHWPNFSDKITNIKCNHLDFTFVLKGTFRWFVDLVNVWFCEKIMYNFERAFIVSSYLLNVFWHWFRYGAYIGNTYGAGTGPECLDNVLCDGTETSFKYCGFSITPHDDPSEDVSIQCFAGILLIVSVTIITGISTSRLQSPFADIADSPCRFHNNRIVERVPYIVGWTREAHSGARRWLADAGLMYIGKLHEDGNHGNFAWFAGT